MASGSTAELAALARWPCDGERDSLAHAGAAAVGVVRKDGGLGGSEGGVTAAILLTSQLFKEQPEPKSGDWMGSLRAQDRGSWESGSLAQSVQRSPTAFFNLLIVIDNSNNNSTTIIKH